MTADLVLTLSPEDSVLRPTGKARWGPTSWFWVPAQNLSPEDSVLRPTGKARWGPTSWFWVPAQNDRGSCSTIVTVDFEPR
jgi:uncharacterized metal-binding protein